MIDEFHSVITENDLTESDLESDQSNNLETEWTYKIGLHNILQLKKNLSLKG